MKKNKMMRISAVLLVMVILTMSVVSGTFAKYITRDSGSDEARVAKWGVELQVIGNLYGDSYDDLIVLQDDASLAVQSLNKSDDVVAPGTKNVEGFTFSLNGQPEVDGKVTSTITTQNIFLAAGEYGVMIPVGEDVVTEDNYREFEGLYVKDGDVFVASTAWADVDYYTLEDAYNNTAIYYPVVYALAGNTTSTGDFTADSLKLAADAIAAQLGLTITTAPTVDNEMVTTYTGVKTFETNTDLATWALGAETLTWEWAFENTDKDGADTILGLLEKTTDGTVVKKDGSQYKAPVEYTDYCLETQFSLDITVEQRD